MRSSCISRRVFFPVLLCFTCQIKTRNAFSWKDLYLHLEGYANYSYINNPFFFFFSLSLNLTLDLNSNFFHFLNRTCNTVLACSFGAASGVNTTVLRHECVWALLQDYGFKGVLVKQML